MNDPLELPLRDIHLPDYVSIWPLAYGWWVLIAVIIITGSLAVFFYLRNKKRKLSAITLARAEFLNIFNEYEKNRDSLKFIKQVSVLFRRLSISLFPRTEVASLTGDNWLEFLDSKISGKPFTQGKGRIIIEAPYRQNIESDDVNEFIQHSRDWVESASTFKESKA